MAVPEQRRIVAHLDGLQAKVDAASPVCRQSWMPCCPAILEPEQLGRNPSVLGRAVVLPGHPHDAGIERATFSTRSA